MLNKNIKIYNEVDRNLIISTYEQKGKFHGYFGPIGKGDVTSFISQLAACRDVGMDIDFHPVTSDGKVYIDALFEKAKEFNKNEGNKGKGM